MQIDRSGKYEPKENSSNINIWKQNLRNKERYYILQKLATDEWDTFIINTYASNNISSKHKILSNRTRESSDK